MWEALHVSAVQLVFTLGGSNKVLLDAGAHTCHLQHPVILVNKAPGVAWKAQANASLVKQESIAPLRIPQTPAHVWIVRRGFGPAFLGPQLVTIVTQEDGAARLLPQIFQLA